MPQGSGSRLPLRTQISNVEANLQQSLVEIAHLGELIEDQERLATLGGMAAGIVHELNNAFTPIVATASMLDVDADDANRELLEIVQVSSLHASEVLQQFRHFFVSDQLKPGEAEAVRLAEAVERAIQLSRFRWKNEAQQRGVEYRIETSVPRDLVVMGNATDLAQLLINLLLNAIEAMPDGGKIEISAKTHEATIEFHVADEGMGFSGEGLESQFTPFFTTKQGGSGLGLVMCQRIVARHHGKLFVETRDEGGSRFVVTLPRKTDAVATAGTAAIRLSNALHRGQVLVVDDDATTSHLKSLALMGLGFDVDVMTEPQTGIAELADADYQLIFLDLPLPLPDMADIIAMLKLQQPDVQVILITGWPRDEVNSCFVELGVEPDYVIEKPYGKKQILDCVQTLLG